MANGTENRNGTEQSVTLPDFAALHKQDFRFAFDYLEKHWPPKWDDAWWQERAKELGPLYNEMEKNGHLLGAELLLAMYTYLEKALKKWWPEERKESA